MPRFGKDKDNRREELDRQAAEEVERLTRRGGSPSGMPGMGGPPQMGIPSPLEVMADQIRERPRASERRAVPAARRSAPPAFTPLPTGGVGDSLGPAGLSPGPRMAGSASPPPTFGGAEDVGGPVSGPPVYNAGAPDEEEEMSITEMALMDHAARTGHNPEDLVMQYDASSAEEMREAAMRAFHDRQQSRRPVAATNNPFAAAGMRGGPPAAASMRRSDDPKAAGGALAQRLAERRRREEEEARRARGEPEPGSEPEPGEQATAGSEGALARVLARRRQALGLENDASPVAAPEPEPAPSPPPGRRHAQQRMDESPNLRGATLAGAADAAPTLEEMAAGSPARRPGKAAKKPAAAKKSPPTAKAPGGPAPTEDKAGKGAARKARTTATAVATTSPAVRKATPAKRPPAKVAPAKKKDAPTTTAPAKTAASPPAPAKKAPAPANKIPVTAKKAPAAAKKVKVKAVFCIECGEKNPAIAKFCFSCGTRLAAPEG